MSELPKGWAISSIDDLISLNPRNECLDDAEVGFAPMNMIGTAYRSKIEFERRKWAEVKKGYTHFADGDVLLAKITPCFENGKAGLVSGLPNGLGAGSTEYFVCRTRSDALLPEYLLAFFKTRDFLRNGEIVMTGSVGHKRVPKDYLLQSEIPLPPLNEQKRIAAKLDDVLSRVDAYRAHLDRVPLVLKRFRKAVLAAAMSGRLTEEWRAINGNNSSFLPNAISGGPVALPSDYRRLSKQSFKIVKIEHSAGELPEGWVVLTIGALYNLNVLIDFADGNHGSLYPRKEDFGESGALFLTATQIGENWELDINKCPRLVGEKARQLTKGWARNNDVVLTHNATVGRVAMLEGLSEEVLLGTSATFYRFNEHFILPRFAKILFSSPFFQEQLEGEMQQTTRNQVPITKQVSLHFICPPIEEQCEIVRRVEACFAYADRFETYYKAARAYVEKLTPAILAKAFRGELVRQDPNDEPASVLLERIKAERNGAAKPRSRAVKNGATLWSLND